MTCRKERGEKKDKEKREERITGRKNEGLGGGKAWPEVGHVYNSSWPALFFFMA